MLVAAQRTGFNDAHPIAYLAGIVLIVDHKLSALLDDLFVQPVSSQARHLDDYRLVHFVAKNHALHPPPLSLHTAVSSSSNSRSRKIVSIRAMSRFT
jgi:hypothetical protein